MMNYEINQELCQKCKLCIEVCPCNILGINQQHEVHFIPERISICQNCGHCMAVCKTKAIRAGELEYEEDFMDIPLNQVDYHHFMDFLANRRSVRNFRDKRVPDELIDRILESISFAPYGAAPEKINITVVNSREIIESALPHIEEFLEKVPKWMEHPIASRLIKTRNTPERFQTIREHLYPIAKMGNYRLKYGDRITRNAPAIIILHAAKDAEEHTNNSLIFAAYMMLTAHSLGLGTTLIGLVPPAINKVDRVREIFQIPEGHEAIISLIIGFPGIRFKRAIKRKKASIQWLV